MKILLLSLHFCFEFRFPLLRNSLLQRIYQRIFSSQAAISAESAHIRKILPVSQGTEQ